MEKNKTAELKATIDSTPSDVVIIGTPIDIRRVMILSKPTVRVKYELQVLGPVSLEHILNDFVKRGTKQ